MYNPLVTLPSNTNIIKFFTLNYDGLIEIICELNQKKYSDGFSPYWNPINFEEKEVQIFKLHGSLFWLSLVQVKKLKNFGVMTLGTGILFYFFACISLAGFPAIFDCAGTLFNTLLPNPISVYSPMVIPFMIFVPLPI